jgi:ADP-ribose pyrophosphatase
MKIITTKTLAETQYLDLKETEYQDKKNTKKSWVWANRPNGRRAVVIAAVVDRGWKLLSNKSSIYKRDLRLVVTKEYRIPLADYEYGFPAGLVDKDENPIEAAKRELNEETGLKVTKVLLESPYIYNTAGMTDESIAMVYVECKGETNQEGLEDSEEIETLLMTPKEVKNLLLDVNKKFGAKAWIVMNYFANNNSII